MHLRGRCCPCPSSVQPPGAHGGSWLSRRSWRERISETAPACERCRLAQGPDPPWGAAVHMSRVGGDLYEGVASALTTRCPSPGLRQPTQPTQVPGRDLAAVRQGGRSAGLTAAGRPPAPNPQFPGPGPDPLPQNPRAGAQTSAFFRRTHPWRNISSAGPGGEVTLPSPLRTPSPASFVHPCPSPGPGRKPPVNLTEVQDENVRSGAVPVGESPGPQTQPCRPCPLTARPEKPRHRLWRSGLRWGHWGCAVVKMRAWHTSDKGEAPLQGAGRLRKAASSGGRGIQKAEVAPIGGPGEGHHGLERSGGGPRRGPRLEPPRSQLGRGHTGSQSPCCTGEWHGRVRVPRLGAGAGPGAGTVQGPLQVARLSQGGGHQRGVGHRRRDCWCR